MTPQPGFRDTIAAKRLPTYDRDHRALWRVLEPLLYWSPSLQCWLVVPAQFVTNYASVPRMPIIYAWCGDRVYEPPGLHDLGYTLRGFLVATVDDQFRILSMELVPFSREQIDAVFLESLLLQPDAVDEATAHAMHLGVRLGGESSWLAETTVDQPEFIRKLILPAEPTAVEQTLSYAA